MKRFLIILSLLGLSVAGAAAKDLRAELVFSRYTWKGKLQGRENDMIVFWRDGKTRAVPIGISTIEEIKFDVEFDEEELIQLLNERRFDSVIRILETTLRPFELYSDVPSNLTPYNFKLMQVYYWNKNFDKSLELSESIMADDKNPTLQQSAAIFHVLSLVETGKLDEAQKMMDEVNAKADTGDMADAASLYTQAKILALRGEKNAALEVAAKVVAFHSQDPDWMPPAELLCAEMYAELGYYDSAQEVIYEIGILHKNTPEVDSANKLKLRVDRMRAEERLKSLDKGSEEA